MPRSAIDATRFTSTTPHASAKPSSASKLPLTTPSQRGTPGAGAETPQEKVKRLRAAADRARDAQVSNIDRLVVRGRVWADRAHRFTALSLIGATVIAAGVTVYALGDMMIYNRKKRAQFFAEQKALHQSAIYNARQAIETGLATEADIKFLQLEEEHEAQVAEVARAKAAKKGIFKRSKEWLFSGLKKEEGDENELASGGKSLALEGSSEGGARLGQKESDVARAIEMKKSDFSDKAKQAFEDERQRQRTGGPLDRIGVSSPSAEEQPKAGGWTSFMTRR